MVISVNYCQVISPGRAGGIPKNIRLLQILAIITAVFFRALGFS
jgi:hypothetical protein